MNKLILASASPRRRSLIQLLGLSIEIQAADVDESSVTVSDPAINVVETARIKALHVAALQSDAALVIGSDTTVAFAGQMLNKPRSTDEAREMLRMLRGQMHQVHTGLVVVNSADGNQVTDVATVDVPMRAYSDDEIERYIESGDPMDKAGAYAIQHAGFHPVSRRTGCYAGVVGLPLCHLTRLLRHFDVVPKNDVPSACQQANQYDCSVFGAILEGR